MRGGDYLWQGERMRTDEARTRRNECIEFCQRCGTRLIFTLGFSAALACSSCEYKKDLNKVSSRVPRRKSEEGVIVVSQRMTELQVLPTVKTTCSKCSEQRAYCKTAEVGEEEALEVLIFRCTRCRHT